MARKVLIQVRRGLESAIGTLAVGELGYCTDTSKLYIGTAASGNVLLVAAQTSGDMLKSIYDTNNDGKVDYAAAADAVPWTGVAGKPSTFPPSTHTHDQLSPRPLDYRDGLSLPSTYDQGINVFLTNNPVNKFNGVAYCTVMTIKGYGIAGNMAAVQYIYPYNVDAPISYRYALYNSDTWLPWRSLPTTSQVLPATGVSWNQLKGV